MASLSLGGSYPRILPREGEGETLTAPIALTRQPASVDTRAVHRVEDRLKGRLLRIMRNDYKTGRRPENCKLGVKTVSGHGHLLCPDGVQKTS